jgi:hypothetical protein
MEYDQTVIIKFLWKDRADARQIADRLQAQFAEHFYQLRTVRFWIVEIRPGRQDLHDEIRSGRPPLDDLDSKILAILEKSPFESFHSIADLVARTGSRGQPSDVRRGTKDDNEMRIWSEIAQMWKASRPEPIHLHLVDNRQL